jgi:two-component system, sensor histidine kinase YesM
VRSRTDPQLPDHSKDALPDILDFKIEVDEDVAENTILKLILQPLVENALYHGIKNKRQGGTISVRARRQGEEEILLEVEDDGIGFHAGKAAQLRAELEDDRAISNWKAVSGSAMSTSASGCITGKPYGLSVQSEYHRHLRDPGHSGQNGDSSQVPGGGPGQG